jgi:dTMP kinase
MKGKFITFEGIDGSGKSTQLRLTVEKLSSLGFPVVKTREPGGTVLGEWIREILLDPSVDELDCTTEVLLYASARSQLVKETIKPALERGALVVSERFADSTVAYQGYGLGLPIDSITAINAFACNGVSPDLTLLFDVDPELARSRIQSRRVDRIECRDIEYYRRVQEGYLAIARREPDRVKIMDASVSIEEVKKQVSRIILDFVRRVEGGAEHG